MKHYKGMQKMTIKITQLGDEAILLAELSDPYQPREDSEAIKRAVYELYQKAQRPIALISTGEVSLGFSDAMIAMATMIRGEIRLNDFPVTLYPILPVESELTKIVLQAVTKGLYGGIRVKVCPTVDAALTAIRTPTP
jgi:hypothetical protein